MSNSLEWPYHDFFKTLYFSWVSVDHSATQPSSLSFNKQDRAEIPIKPKGPTKVEVPSVNSINEDMLKHIPGLENFEIFKMIVSCEEHLLHGSLGPFSYMKGRLKASNVNEFISKFNATVQEKYKLLRKARNSLSSQEKQLVQNFKLQETKLTKGELFIKRKTVAKLSSVIQRFNACFDAGCKIGLHQELRLLFWCLRVCNYGFAW